MADPDIYYFGIGKSITSDGSTLFTAYGADLSPQHPAITGTWNTLKATEESTYNCSGFQMGNSVLAYTFTFLNRNVVSTGTIDIYLFKDDGGWTLTGYHKTLNINNPPANSASRYYTELSIYDRQIMNYANDYRLILQFNYGGYTNTYEKYFSVTNFYVDSDVYTECLLTVRGTNLVYTDYSGYKHIIQYDSNYSGSYVGTNKSGKMWVQDGVVRRLYYVDQNGYVRRTYEADNRYGSTSGQGAYAGSQYAGALWTGGSGSSGASDHYLCFVNSSGYKMRLMNGDPNNF